MSRKKLQDAINSITEKEFETALNSLSKKPKKTEKELEEITEGMTESQIDDGLRQYGGADEFISALISFLAIKGILIRKGIKLGVATGAGAVLIFGTGSLCHGIASATGVVALDDIAEGIDLVGELALDVSELGFAVAEDGLDFFGGLLEGVFSIFG